MRSSSRVRPPTTPEQREEILAASRQTSLSSHQFARQHGIAASTLFRWLRESPTSGDDDTAGWIEVPNLIGSRSPAPACRLCFSHGLSVEIAAGFQAEAVRPLAEVIGGL